MKRWLFLLYYPLPILGYMGIAATTAALRLDHVRWPIVIVVDSLWIVVPVVPFCLVTMHAHRKFDKVRERRKNSN